MEVRAVAKNVHHSPQKVRLVADQVRGRTVNEALAILQFMPQAAAVDVSKVIKSAASNAENNYELERNDLYVYRLFVDEGMTLKRIKARSHGRVAPRLHRWSHITAVVQEKGAS